MSQTLTPQKTDMGWIIEIPNEIAMALNVAQGSIALLYPKEGSLETEILPPPSPEMQSEFERLYNKYEDTLEELKEIGD